MKKIYLGIIGLVCAIGLTFALKAHASTPYPPWLTTLWGDVSFNDNGDVELGAASVGGAELAEESSTAGALYGQKVARFVYDVAVNGGSIAAHGLGVTLPAKAVITRSFFKIITQFSDSGSGTIALSCEDANNIKTATDITGSAADAFVEGQSTGAASAFVRGIAAACEITATPAGVTADAGKLVGWVSYVIEN